jgi:hypothetical protein
MSKNDQYLIIIPNAITPYGYELTKIMAYPKGFRYRFRFDEEWVHEEVRNNFLNLVGKKGLIIIRDMDEAKFYPIRYFILKHIRRIGTIYYFEYELGEFIDFSSDEGIKSNQLADFNSKFKEFHKSKIISNNPGEHMRPLVLLTRFELNIKNEHYISSDIEGREFEQWGNIVTLTTHINFYDGVEFIKLIKAEPMKLNGRKSYFKNDFLYLKECEDYNLMILQLVPKGGLVKPRPRDILVKSDSKYIEILRNRARAVGKYDVLTFLFRVRANTGGHNSFLDIEHIPKTEAEQYIEPKLYIPIRINKSSLKLLIKFALFILFTFGYILFNIHLPTSLVFLKNLPTLLGFLKDSSLIGVTIIIIELLKEIRGFLRQD